jgi:hypothetical protein
MHEFCNHIKIKKHKKNLEKKEKRKRKLKSKLNNPKEVTKKKKLK